MYRIFVLGVALILLVVAGTNAIAADPVAVQNPVPVGSFAEVKYDLAPGDAITWDIFPEPTKTSAYTDGQTAVVVFNGEAGGYVVKADIINFETKKRSLKKITVTISAPNKKVSLASPSTKTSAKAGCICGDNCNCAAGECPAKCPVSAPTPTPTSVPAFLPQQFYYVSPTYPSCSSGSCPTPTNGFYFRR